MITRFLNIDFPENIISSSSQDELRRINIVNYICLITISNMLLYIGIYSFLDFHLFKPAIYFLFLCTFLSIGIIVVNKKGFYNTAKLLVGILTPFYMISVVLILFGKRPEFQVFLLLAGTIPIFIWSFKQKGYLIFFIIIYFIIYLLLEFFTLPFDPLIIIPDKFIPFFRSSNIIICFMGMGAAIGFYQWFINIKEKQLINQAEELKISQAHKDIVYSVIAHDLKGPFGSFVGLTNYFLNNFESYDKAKLKETIERMNENFGSVLILLENLLDWSKMQSGNLEQNKIDFCINTVAEDVIKLNRELSNEKKQTIKTDIESNIKVFADSYMISTIFRNLISNAIKFTPKNGNILVSAKTNKDEVEICIADSGVGIAESDIEYIFDIKKVAKNPLIVSNKGGGLGLLICKDFVESNQGKIWVESKQGKGSKFYFTLKLSNHST